MARALSTGLKASLFGPRTGSQILIFADITHPSLGVPVRVVDDVKDYVWSGNIYTGLPFQLELLTDGEGPPRGRLTMANIDRRLGEIARALATPPRLRLTVLVSDDFVMTADPRTEIGAATVEYQASNLALRGIRADVSAVQADIVSFDPGVEPFPWVRTTKDKAPGLYR